MNTASLVEVLRPLPRRQRIRVTAQVDRLRRTCDSDQPLDAFLTELLSVVGRLFGASASAFWFRPFNAGALCASVRIGFEESGLSTHQVKAVDGPVLSRWRAAEPNMESPQGEAFAVIVAPIRNGDDAIGAIQLVLTELPQNWEESEQLYLAAMRSVLTAIQPVLHRRMQIRAVSLSDAESQLDQLSRQLNGIQRSIRQSIERYLQRFTGATFGSIEDNQQFLRAVQELLETHGLRVRCPECGHPAILRCSRSNGSAGGAFVFDHYIDRRRTFHGGGSTMPSLRVVAKPVRRPAIAAN